MSYVLFSSITRTARKAHTCIWCGQKISVGSSYFDERSVYDGNIQRQRWHPECYQAGQEEFAATREEEFTPWDNQRPTAEAKP